MRLGRHAAGTQEATTPMIKMSGTPAAQTDGRRFPQSPQNHTSVSRPHTENENKKARLPQSEVPGGYNGYDEQRLRRDYPLTRMPTREANGRNNTSTRWVSLAVSSDGTRDPGAKVDRNKRACYKNGPLTLWSCVHAQSLTCVQDGQQDQGCRLLGVRTVGEPRPADRLTGCEEDRTNIQDLQERFGLRIPRLFDELLRNTMVPPHYCCHACSPDQTASGRRRRGRGGCIPSAAA